MSEVKRKGARTTKDIPREILEQLNSGEIETANAVEWFAIDRRKLLKNVLLEHNREKYYDSIIQNIDRLKKQTSNTVSEAIGEGLLQQSLLYQDGQLFEIISTYKSDLVRSWGAFMIAKDSRLDIHQVLKKVRIYAAIDYHTNVREEAWCAIRPNVIENLEESLSIFSKWVLDDDERIRRFASEITRPRGVCCKHISILKEQPELALSILEPLKSDESKYVRDSVGNWLNDASKTQPIFVTELCKRWENESNTMETKYIIKKALRTIMKLNTV